MFYRSFHHFTVHLQDRNLETSFLKGFKSKNELGVRALSRLTALVAEQFFLKALVPSALVLLKKTARLLVR